jgi:hypothetical protein
MRVIPNVSLKFTGLLALRSPSHQQAALLHIRCNNLAASGPKPPHVLNAIAANDQQEREGIP